MGGNGIGVESIQHQNVEIAIRRLFDREPSVSNDDVARISASSQVSKKIVSDVVNLRIDIEECNVAIRPSPARHGSCSESNYCDVLIGTHADELHDVADRSGLVVVRQRTPDQCRIHTLDSVKRIAV